MKITMHNGRPVVALTGWDLAVVTEALGTHVAQAGGRARRASVLLASMQALDRANIRNACTCGSREHHPADCPSADGARRLRAVGSPGGERPRRKIRRDLR